MTAIPRTFRGRIVALVMGAVLLPLAVMGAVVYHAEDHFLREAYGKVLEHLAGRSAQQVTDWLAEQGNVARSLASNRALVSACQAFRESPPDSDESFVELFRLHRLANLIEDGFPWILEVRLSDPQTGRVFFSTHLESIGGPWVPPAAAAPQDWEQVLRGGTVLTDLVPSERALRAEDGSMKPGVPTWFLSCRVSSEGDAPAVMTIRVDALALARELVDENVYLADARGRMLTSPTYVARTPGTIFRERPALEVRLVDADGQPTAPYAGFLSMRAGRPVEDRLLMEGYRDFRGQRVVGAWAPVQDTNWIAVSEVSEDRLLQPLRNILRLTVGLMAGVGLLFGLLAWYLSRQLTAPLKELSDVAVRLSAGDRSCRCNWNRDDEMGQVARTFDGMASAIEATLAELEDARDRALDASRAKSRFLANMSHELRTPLNAIIGYSEMLLEEAEDSGNDAGAADLRNIQLAGIHLLSLINGILDLSKIEAGKMSVFLETFPVADVVTEVVATVTPLVRQHGNRLETDLGPDLGTLRADRTKLRQILYNLLSNALKFTKDGVVTLAVARQGEEIAFEVRDTGIGMTEAQVAKVFEEFAQADDSTTRRFGGTGLGLTLVKHFVEMLGGRIDVRSRPGEGTVFTVRLQAEGAALEECPAEAAPRDTILVIDDDVRVLDLMGRFLEKEGYRVVTAESGEEGLRIARAIRPGVITLDVMMPGMHGWTVLSRLKADPLLADIPVVMLTMVEDRNVGFALGAAEYLTKPLDKDRLVRVLDRYLERRPTGPILVVEDDAATRQLIGQALGKENRRVVYAENGRVALERLEGETPGLILLDLRMPEMDGFEFLAHLRQRGLDVPVVVMTAMDMTPEVRARLGEQVVSVLEKSGVDLDRVREAVRAQLGALLR